MWGMCCVNCSSWSWPGGYDSGTVVQVEEHFIVVSVCTRSRKPPQFPSSPLRFVSTDSLSVDLHAASFAIHCLTRCTARQQGPRCRASLHAMQVLFRPNTMFEITSTLYNTSVIGEFYSGTDNIAMVELTCAGAYLDSARAAVPPAGRGACSPAVAVPRGLPDAARILVDVPDPFFFTMLGLLTGTEAVAAEVLEVRDGDADGKFAQVVAVPTGAEASSPLLPGLPPPKAEELGSGACSETVPQPPMSPKPPAPGLSLVKEPPSLLRSSQGDALDPSSPFFPWYHKPTPGTSLVDFGAHARRTAQVPAGFRSGRGSPPSSIITSPRSGASRMGGLLKGQWVGSPMSPQRLPVPTEPRLCDGGELLPPDVESRTVPATPVDSCRASLEIRDGQADMGAGELKVGGVGPESVGVWTGGVDATVVDIEDPAADSVAVDTGSVTICLNPLLPGKVRGHCL